MLDLVYLLILIFCEQQELTRKKENIQRSIQERERIIQTLPQIFQANKVSLITKTFILLKFLGLDKHVFLNALHYYLKFSGSIII